MFQASVVEFYSPARFFVIAQSPELLEALQSITTELQKTYSGPSVTTYVPCVGEVCMVQFSCDLVSRCPLKDFNKILVLFLTLLRVCSTEMVQRPRSNFVR